MATAVGLSLSIFTSIIAHRAALFGCRFFLNYVKLREFISIPKKVSLFLSVRLIKSQANLLFTYLPVAWVCTNPRPSLGGEIPIFLGCPDVDPMHSPKIGYSCCSQ